MEYENECVDIILINYNNYIITQDCVLSLIGNDYQKVNIIIIDNNSSNDAVLKLDDFFSKLNNDKFSYKFVKYISKTKEYYIDKFENLMNNIVLISSDENNGYSAGNNIGISLSKKYFKSKYIWILNNDTVIKKDALRLLVDYSNKNENAFIGSTIAHFNQQDIIQTACGNYFYPFLGYVMVYNANKKIEELSNIKAKYNYIIGVSIFTRAKNVFEINGFDERYFLYADDMDFCFKAKKNGLSLLWCKASIIYHKGGASIGSTKNLGERTYISEYHSDLAMFQFNKKWHPILYKLFNFNRYHLKHLQFTIKRKEELMKALKDARKYFKENC